MPLYASAFFLPSSPSLPFIIEDIYIRGGYRAVATIAERDAIKPATRKKGMIVYVAEDNRMYQITGALGGAGAWKPFDVTEYVNFLYEEPLELNIDEETGERTVSIKNERLLPTTSEETADYVLVSTSEGPAWVKLEIDALPSVEESSVGNALILDDNKKPIWAKVQALPDTDESEQGYVLSLDENKVPRWVRPTAMPTVEGGVEGQVLSLDSELNLKWLDVKSLPDSNENDTDKVLTVTPNGPEWQEPYKGIEVPVDTPKGSVLVINDEGEAVWGVPAETKRKHTQTFDLGTIVGGGKQTLEFDLETSTLIMLELLVSAPEIQIELHSTNNYNDNNPFVFISSAAKLADDGITYDELGNPTIHRRYSFYADLSNQNKLHVNATNLGDMVRNVTVTLLYVDLEN